MRKSMTNILIICILLWGSLACANKPLTQLQEVKKTTESYIEAETYKAVERELVQTLISEHHSQFITKAIKNKARATMVKVSQAMAGMSSSQRVKFLKKLAHSSKDGFKKLAKMSKGSVSHYLNAVKNTKSLKSLKELVAGNGDKAGSWVLKKVADMDSLIARGGKVSKNTLKRLMQGAKELPPKRAKAFLDMISKKMTTDWSGIAKGGNAAASLVGTVVDGVFVLNDAYNIYYLDDPEEKAIQATGKIIEYGSATATTVVSGTVTGATTTALGGFLPGLVIALSANRVGTLYNEIMMLQKEREDTKSTLRNEKIDNGILVRRQLIKANHLIEKGELRKAEHLLYQVHKWSNFKSIENASKLSELRRSLEKNIKTYKRKAEINSIINRARFPYREAGNLYHDGRELTFALKQAKKSRSILEENIAKYPEIRELKALGYIEKLIVAINAKMANVKPLQIVSVTGPKQVVSGEIVHYSLEVIGGIPDYNPVKIEGYGTKNYVTLYWQAPQKLGKKIVQLTVQDSIGSKASISVKIEVIAKEKEVKGIKLIAYTQVHLKESHEIMPGLEGQKSVNVEAHDVYPGTDIYFVVNVDKSDYTYKWKINGVDDNSAGKYGKWGHAFWLKTADEPHLERGVIGNGVNTISVVVYDKKGKRIGSDSWTVYIKDTSKDEYLMSPLFPDGDE